MGRRLRGWTLPRGRHPNARVRTIRRAVVVATAAILAGTTTAGATAATGSTSATTTGATTGGTGGASAAGVPTRPAVIWRTDLCTPDARKAGEDLRTRSPGARVECARVVVPLDWARPGAGTITLLVTRVPRRAEPGDTRATRVLFVNPGGPGAAADWMAPGVAFAEPQLHRVSDIVAVDPRGTGGSTPLACLVLDDGVDDYRTPDAREIALQQATARREVAGCAAQAPRYLRHISTAATIRDLDHVRSLLGADTIDYYGVSAGTWLGARYAQTYPRRVGRFVLDGNTQFTADWRTSFGWQPRGFERRFRQQFLPWLARRHETYRLGRSASATGAAYERLRARVAAGELAEFTANDLDSVVVEGLYFDANFPDLAELLAALTTTLFGQGQSSPGGGGSAGRAASAQAAVTAFHRRVLGADGARPAEAERSAEHTVFMAVQCNDDVWDPRPSSYLREGLDLGARYPLLGYTWVTSACAYWPYRPNPLPRPTGKGVPPMLMVQSELDPATPWEGASLAHRAHTSTRLLTVDDSGNHGSLMTGNRCVETTVITWLTKGLLPTPDATCRGLPLPGDDRVYAYRLRRTTARPAASPATPRLGGAAREGTPARTRTPEGSAAGPSTEAGPSAEAVRQAEERFRQRLLGAIR